MMNLRRQIVHFILTGGVNTVFGYLVYAASAGLLDLSYAVSLIASYVVGVPFSYMMFRAFVFTDGERGFKTSKKFLPTYAALLVFNMVALHMAVGVFGWNKLVAQALIVPVCAALSFIINRLFVFKRSAP